MLSVEGHPASCSVAASACLTSSAAADFRKCLGPCPLWRSAVVAALSPPPPPRSSLSLAPLLVYLPSACLTSRAPATRARARPTRLGLRGRTCAPIPRPLAVDRGTARVTLHPLVSGVPLLGWPDMPLGCPAWMLSRCWDRISYCLGDFTPALPFSDVIPMQVLRPLFKEMFREAKVPCK